MRLYLTDPNGIWRGQTFDVTDPRAAMPSGVATAPPGTFNPSALVAWRGGAWVAVTEPAIVTQAEQFETQGDAGWFWLRLFTAAERGRWSLLLRHIGTLTSAQLAADPWLLGVFNADLDIQRARLIDLSAESVVAGVRTLCRHSFNLGGGLTLTVLETDQRANEVLAGRIVA